jgi:hypothetical protein
MARSWYFPRWRHLLMQMVMWIVLGTSMVLAAMLDHRLRQGQIIDFSPTITDDSLSFRLPATWKTWAQRNDADVTEHVATDSVAGVVRTLTISRQRVPHVIAPAEYILRVLPYSRNLDAADYKGVVIDGWPGQSITWAAHRVVSLGAGEEFQFTNCSAIVLPGDQAIMVRLDKNAPFDAADERLYRQVLETVHVSTPAPSDGGTIQLANNITISAPADLSVYPRVDALCSEATVAQITDEGGWISAEFVPVAVPDNEPSASLLAGLAAREQLDPLHAGLADAWISSEIAAQSPNHWTFIPPDSSTDPVSPRRIAHLLTADGGWGLVVILSAEPPASLSDLNHLWDELSANIRIGEKSPPLASALAAGAAIARAATFSAPADTWWMWSRGSVPVGFTHGFADRDAKFVFRYTVRRNWNGAATAVLQQWGTNTDSSPWSRMTRLDAAANLNEPLIPFFDQTTALADQITTVVHEPNGQESQSDTPLNPAFVLSRYLPGLLSRVDSTVDSTRTAIWTDRFPAVEAEHFPSPLLLLANRVDDASGFRCVQAEVNGTGRLSRWYFRADGALDHADFAGDLHLNPSSEAEVESAFAGDRRLTIQPH